MCGLYRGCKRPYMMPWVPPQWTGRLLVVGEAPGADEDERTGRPFTGPAGRLLRKYLRGAGYQPHDVAMVNACRCRPRGNATPTMAQIRACRPFLLSTIQQWRPKYVIAVGSVAMRALTDDGSRAQITASRGRVLAIPGLESAPPVYATYHPSAVLRGGHHYGSCIVEDLARVSWAPLPAPEDRVPTSNILAVDTEYDANGAWLTVAVADATAALAADVSDGWSGLSEILSAIQQATTVCGHHLGVDLDYLTEHGVARPEWVEGRQVLDSLLLTKLANENLGRGAYRLERVFLARYRSDPWKDQTTRAGDDAAAWPPEARKERCRMDAWASAVLARDLAPTLPASLIEFVHRAAAVLHRVGLAGMVVDKAALDEVDRVLEQDLLVAEELLRRHAFRAGMTAFDASNDHHVRELLYKRLRLPVVARTATTRAPATDKATLMQLRTEHEAVGLLLEYRRARKLYSTYVQGVRRLLRPWASDEKLGWLPVQIHALGARTGRRSSGRMQDSDSDNEALNLQNWPGCKSTCAPDCVQHPKRLIVSRFSGGRIANYDYKSLEPFVLAWLAQDEALYSAFKDHGGYIYFGKRLWGREIKKDTPEYTALKATILGTHYGAGEYQVARVLWDRVGVRLASKWERHVERVKALRRRYLDAVPQVRQYMRERRREVLQTQQVVGLLGRVRHLPHPFRSVPERGSPEWRRWKHIANEAINYPVQWGAACVTGAALIDVEAALLRAYGLSTLDWHRRLLAERRGRPPAPVSRIINEVHDAIVVDLHPDHASRDADIIEEAMVQLPTLRPFIATPRAVPLRLAVDRRVAERWT